MKKNKLNKPVGFAFSVAAALLAAGMHGQAFAAPAPSGLEAPAQSLVTGVVVDQNGDPIIGAQIQVSGTNVRTATDLNGRYSIRAAKGDKLEVSYVGFARKVVTVAGSVTDITLQSTNDLDEVVVVGYGAVRKADLAGSVSVLDDKAFAAQPITQISDALQGRVSGVNVISDGLPGGSVKIRVRGSNSINKSNEPLYVVDGLVRESGLDGINPEDIASMQILKDASATAIYGSRGANGVVIITTKKGTVGKSSIVFDAAVGVSQATHLPKTLNAQEYAEALVKYKGQDPAPLQNYIDGKDAGTDWADEVFHNGTTQNYKLVFNKGSEGLQFYLSGNYMKHEGIIRNTEFERYQARASVQADVAPWLNVNVDLNLSHGQGKGIGGLALGGYNPIYLAYNYSPSMPVMNEAGEYLKDEYCSINESPLATINNQTQRRRDVVNAHVDLRFKIVKGLTFTTSNGLDYYNGYGYGFSSSKRWPGATSSMSNSNSNRWLLQTTNNFTYINTFADKHNLTATLVWEATKSTTRKLDINGEKLSPESVGWWNYNNAAVRNGSNGYSEWALLSGVGRVIYNFDNRYMLTGTLRADGSSRLSNNKWSWFPSVAAAWTASNESFFASVKPVMNQLKVRASFGIIGNQDISPYQTLAMMSATTTYYGTSQAYTGYWANQVGAPDLKWERTRQVDAGLDLGFFNNRLEVNFDWYYKRTYDALLNTTLADYLGGSSYMVNAGEVSNTGVDIALNGRIIEGKDWRWTSAINLSWNRNRVEKMTTAEPILYSGSMQSIVTDASIIKEGEPIGTLYGYDWAGIDAEGYDTYYTADGQVTRHPGADDRVVLGKATPSVTLGWNNTVSYKGWSLNAFFNGSFGAKRINALRFAMCSIIGNSRMFTSPDAITEMGSTMPVPTVDNNEYIGNSSKWTEKADYFRLENISLAYEFSRAQTKFADIRLSFSVQNAFTITGYKGINPASFSFGDAAEWQQGVDTGVNPAPRTFTVGARFTF